MTLRDRLFKSHLEENEKILYTAHRTLFILFTDIAKITFLGIIVPFLLFLFIPKLYAICLIWIIIGLSKLCFALFNWYFDAWLVTTQGVIDIQWDGPFTKTATRIEYQNVGGVTYEIKGFFATLFNFGDLHLSDLGSAKISLLSAKRPKMVENNIMQFQEKYLSKQNFEDHDKLKGLLTSMLREHIRKNGLPEDNNERKVRL
jgi:hypothetical protein